MAFDSSPADPPDLTKLAGTYDVESELHRGRSSASFLGRQRQDGRRVTITVIDATTPAQRNALTHLAADSRLLTGGRHPGVVPIVETRWLAANRLAIVRVQMRGSTLRATLDGVGPMPEGRVVEILKDVGEVLDWAARSGIVHRGLNSHAVCFQKGSGRVMVSFGLPAVLEPGNAHLVDETAFVLERCIDGATLARLGYEMLTAHHAGDASAENLRAVRPDLPPRTAEAIETGLRCGPDSKPFGARQFLAALTGEEPEVGATAIATAASAAVVPRGATTPVPPPQLPLGGPSVGFPTLREGAHAAEHARPTELPPIASPQDMSRPPRYIPPQEPVGGGPHGAGAPPRRRRGRAALLVSLVVALALAGGTFYLIDRERKETTVAAARQGETEEAGDVEVPRQEPPRELPPDPGALIADSPGVTVPGATLPGVPVPRTDSVLPPAAPAARPVITPPPPRPAPRVTQPSQRQTEALCASPDANDQAECFRTRLAARDADLNSVYQALARELSARDGRAAVETLRYEQRAWLADRDRRCRDNASGGVWAPATVECMGRISDSRALTLARRLARVRSEPR